MCCRLQHSPQKAQKAQNEFLDFESCRSDGPFCVFVPFVAIKLQTANGFSVTSSSTDWGGKTLNLNEDRPTPIFAKGSPIIDLRFDTPGAVGRQHGQTKMQIGDEAAMSYDSRTTDSFVLEAICMICDFTGKDRHGRYLFTTDQLLSPRMLERIERAATGSSEKNPKETVSRGLSLLVQGGAVEHIPRGKYRLVVDTFIADFHQGKMTKRLSGW